MREFLITPHIKSLQNAAEKLSEVPCISKDCNSKIELWLRRENKKLLNNRWELKAKKQLSYRGGSLPGSLNIAFEFYLKFAEGPSTKSSREFAWKMKNAHFLTTILKCEFRLCMCSWWKCTAVRSVVWYQGMTSDGQSWMLIAESSHQEQLMKLCAG